MHKEQILFRIQSNVDKGPSGVRKYCPTDQSARGQLKPALQQPHLNACAYHRLLKMARTLADLAALMPLALCMDLHAPRAIVGLRLRGIAVLTTFEDGAGEAADPALMDRATELDRVLFSQDADLLAEAARRHASGDPFGGVIYAHQHTPIGGCVRDLEVIADAGEPEDMRRQVQSVAASRSH